jgi:hypothetical protein
MESINNYQYSKNTEIIESGLEKAEKLKSFGVNYNNPIVIIEEGEETGTEEVKSENPGSKEFFLEVCKSYLSGPIFTDNFHEDHYKRREWEDFVEEKIKNLKTEENTDGDIYSKYYKKNRLGVNNYFGVISSLHLLLEELDTEPQLKEKLQRLSEKINEELKELIKINDGVLEYNLLKDYKKDSPDGKEGKVELILKFSSLVKEAISTLEDRS